jgi:hypothetical protein
MHRANLRKDGGLSWEKRLCELLRIGDPNRNIPIQFSGECGGGKYSHCGNGATPPSAPLVLRRERTFVERSSL